MNPDDFDYLVRNKRALRSNACRPCGAKKIAGHTVYDWKRFARLIQRRRRLKFQLRPKKKE
jgi:hypothetical protein